jgi:indolepyruvate ferredoxin oxidoreductase
MLALAPRLPLAEAIPVALMGDSIATNAFMLGLAFQKGTIPPPLEAILRSRS